MGLETNVNTINDLNVLNPSQSDGVTQGDNHLRLIKKALKGTFPNITGPVTKSQDQLDADPFPVGGIILWSGSSSTVPEGWAICDGSNGTPNLRGRFVVGAAPTSSYDVGDTGGYTRVTLQENEMPSHGHGSGSYRTSENGGHKHSGHTWNGGTDWAFTLPSEGDGDDMLRDRKNISRNDDTSTTSDAMESGGGRYRTEFYYEANHRHDLNISSVNDHDHDVAGRSENTGGGEAHENRPPYYALCYIMKL